MNRFICSSRSCWCCFLRQRDLWADSRFDSFRFLFLISSVFEWSVRFDSSEIKLGLSIEFREERSASISLWGNPVLITGTWKWTGASWGQDIWIEPESWGPEGEKWKGEKWKGEKKLAIYSKRKVETLGNNQTASRLLLLYDWEYRISFYISLRTCFFVGLITKKTSRTLRKN